ncbi:MAG: HAD-IA family hydrolase [Opitutaceae bacterium]
MKKFVAVFDADGVLLRSTRPANYLEQRYGLSCEKMAPFLAEIGGCLIGQVDMKTILPDYLERWGVGQSVDEFLAEAFNSGCEIDPEVVEMIGALRKRGITCCLATNQDRHRIAFLDQHLNIRAHFDRCFVSCEMGVKKPNHGFYHAIAEVFPHANFVFWDDSSANVEAACECSWTAFVYTGPAQMRNEIAQRTSQR